MYVCRCTYIHIYSLTKKLQHVILMSFGYILRMPLSRELQGVVRIAVRRMYIIYIYILIYTECTVKYVILSIYSVITDHRLKSRHEFDWDNVKVFDEEMNYNKRLISDDFHKKIKTWFECINGYRVIIFDIQ